jgi:hypothetical protein
MGLDLTWADAAAVMRRRDECWESGGECDHQPSCRDDVEPFPEEIEFPYRQLDDVAKIMERLGMGYEGAILPDEVFSESEMREEAWRWQRLPGKTGIALFKLRSNDRWLVTVPEIDEALAAYAAVPERERAELETGKKWAAWIEWLRQSRQHGGFEVE